MDSDNETVLMDDNTSSGDDNWFSEAGLEKIDAMNDEVPYKDFGFEDVRLQSDNIDDDGSVDLE